VAEERAALQAGDPPAVLADLAAGVEARLNARIDPAAGSSRSSTRPGSSSTRTSAAPRGRGCDRGRPARPEYSSLEFDRESGRRDHVPGRRRHLIALTGAEDAIVTVNNAAALLLAVGLAGRRGVAVSRGELVEIGGGVRIPEMIRRAGARLVEVGTTNRTRTADFEASLADGRVTVVLRVHPSNFTQAGFVEAPDPASLADLAHRHGAIVVDDLGSGAFLDTAAFGLAHEPTPRERLEAGADIVASAVTS
jgi:L-seryl-tRNA(Ser) seleniumtransferase